MMERLLILLPTPIMLLPIMVDVSELDPAGGFAPDGVPAGCVPPGCIPLWPSVPLEPGGGGGPTPIPPEGFAGAPGAVACGSCKFCGGFKLPMSCPAAPT